MCEIFAMSSAVRRSPGDRLKEFFSHSPDHPNGWGLAVSDEGITNVEKEPVRADRSRYLKQRLSETVEGDTIMAHIRYATVGNVERSNCHPFVRRDISGRQWVLIHNGTIFDYPPCDKYIKTQKGETDSERILLYLMDRIAEQTKIKGAPLDKDERFELLENVVVSMSDKNKLNLIIFDGELLYCHTNQKDTLYSCDDGEKAFLSTHPLSEGHWEKAPFLKLFAYKNGRTVMEGYKKSKEYIEDEQAMKHLYLAYSGL